MPVLCVTEVAHLVSTRLDSIAEAKLIADLAAGSLIVAQLDAADLLRIVELIVTYRDLPLGTVDASIVAAAERLGITRIATLDRRDFGVVRPAHVEAFELLP